MEHFLEPPRRSSVTIEDFLQQIASGQPIIVTDAMKGWSGESTWSPHAFRKKFGTNHVQIYNDAFDLRDIRTLSHYLDTHFNGSPSPSGEPTPYVRWYTKLKDVDFVWADSIFEALQDQWTRPYFMPEDGYLLPLVLPPHKTSPVLDLYPAKGLFISGAGARTRLHRDPWQTDAVLFQIYGEKDWVMYDPSQEPLLQDAKGQCVDPEKPDLARFPRFGDAVPNFKFTLKPGEAVLVPQGWYHQVNTTTDSISLTWNFAHRTTQSKFFAYLDSQEASGEDLEVLRFFYSKWLPKDAGCGQISKFLKDQLQAAS